jgi:hypothetical protein
VSWLSLRSIPSEVNALCFVPDIFGFRLLNHSLSEIAGIPVINLRTTPMEGVHRWVKALENWLDIKIILLTLFKGFAHRNAY